MKKLALRIASWLSTRVCIELVFEILEIIVKRTDNKIDDQVLNMIRQILERKLED